LLAPENGTAFNGWNAEVILRWSSAGNLQSNEYYVVSIPYDAAGNTATFWRKETQFKVPSNFSGNSVGFADRHYNWWVQVKRCTSNCGSVLDDNVRKDGVAVSAVSAEGLFFWYSDVGGGGGGGGGDDPKPTVTR
jgi:hypothetical protein